MFQIPMVQQRVLCSINPPEQGLKEEFLNYLESQLRDRAGKSFSIY